MNTHLGQVCPDPLIAQKFLVAWHPCWNLMSVMYHYLPKWKTHCWSTLRETWWKRPHLCLFPTQQIYCRARFTGAGMWILIGKYSQNIEIKRVTTWNNNKVTKNHEYCSTNKAKGWAFSKGCTHVLLQWTRINSNIIHSLAKFSWDTSLEKCLWCSSVPLPLPMLSISNHVSKPSCKPTLRRTGKAEISLLIRWHF